MNQQQNDTLEEQEVGIKADHTYTGVTANATFGNPNAQCMGKGICSMPAASQRSGNGVLVTVQAAPQSPPPPTCNIQIVLNAAALTWLQQNNLTVYNQLTQNPSYTPDQGALPFAIASSIVSEIWPGFTTGSIPPSSSPWSLQQSPNQVTITINGVQITQ